MALNRSKQPPKLYYMSRKPPKVSAITEGRQVFGYASFADALLENRTLPSNYRRAFEVTHELGTEEGERYSFKEALSSYRNGYFADEGQEAGYLAAKNEAALAPVTVSSSMR